MLSDAAIYGGAIRQWFIIGIGTYPLGGGGGGELQTQPC